MPPKKIDFMAEMKQSEEFLNKLMAMKKNAKDIKEKSKLTFHRGVWTKEFQYLTRLARETELELFDVLGELDSKLDVEIETQRVFFKDPYKTYSEMQTRLKDSYSEYQEQIERQVDNLPLLLFKCQNGNEEGVDWTDIRLMLGQIEGFMKQMEAVNDQKLTAFQQQNRPSEANDNGNDDDSDTEAMFGNLRAITNFDKIKGFDLESRRKERVAAGEEQLLGYLNTLEGRLSSDEISVVIEEFRTACQLQDQSHSLQLEKLDLQYEQALSLDPSLIQESNNFRKISHFHHLYLGKGRSVPQYNERLAIEFPKTNRKILDQITAYIEAKIYKAKKTKALRRNYLREREDLFTKVEKEVNLRIETKIKNAQAQAEKLFRKEEKLKLDQELQKLRVEYQARQEEKQVDKKAAEEAEKRREKEKEEMRRLYLDDLNKKAQEVTVIKEQRTKEKDEKIKETKMQEQLVKRRQIEENKPKVIGRQQTENTKIVHRLESRIQKQKAQVERQERIDKAIESYAFRPQVQASEERLVAPTTAMVIKKETKLDKADKVQLSKITGYSVQQLMGDMRFRLNAAFMEAGISNTDYARQVITQMSRKDQ